MSRARRQELYEAILPKAQALAREGLAARDASEFAVVFIDIDSPEWRPMVEAVWPEHVNAWQRQRPASDATGLRPTLSGLWPRAALTELLRASVPDTAWAAERAGFVVVAILGFGGASIYALTLPTSDDPGLIPTELPH